LVILVLVVAACDSDAPADVAGDSAGDPTRPIDTTATSTAATASSSTRSSSRSSEGSPPTSESPVATSGVPGVVPQGFGTIAARVNASDGEVCDLCLWLADDPASRSLGLMQVTDLGGLDGMAFLYDSPHTTSFTMRNTVMPLSIAFFGADGAHLDEFDMEPCAAEPCPSYPTPADFVVAIEVPQGGLAELGVGDGSMLELLAEGCSANSPATP
jgi:uncharacterized protein